MFHWTGVGVRVVSPKSLALIENPRRYTCPFNLNMARHGFPINANDLWDFTPNSQTHWKHATWIICSRSLNGFNNKYFNGTFGRFQFQTKFPYCGVKRIGARSDAGILSGAASGIPSGPLTVVPAHFVHLAFTVCHCLANASLRNFAWTRVRGRAYSCSRYVGNTKEQAVGPIEGMPVSVSGSLSVRHARRRIRCRLWFVGYRQ